MRRPAHRRANLGITGLCLAACLLIPTAALAQAGGRPEKPPTPGNQPEIILGCGGGAQIFRQQLAHQCLAPARGGSYSWTIPNKYSGTGFRIFAAAPGRTSSALGAPFKIE
ncbi:MAG TPA: hypothetical protein VFB10_02475 [Candidatus Dormibacteraeota bacterium]|nr:hypothetical protein [Candidatus Dormibacteraeota bacterium]